MFRCRLQRRDRRVQEHQLHGVGRRRSGQDPAAVAPLLPEHAGNHLRRRLQRQGANLRGSGRAAEDGELKSLENSFSRGGLNSLSGDS